MPPGKKGGESGPFPAMNGFPGGPQYDMPHMSAAGPSHVRGYGHQPHYMGMVGDDVDPNAMPAFH